MYDVITLIDFVVRNQEIRTPQSIQSAIFMHICQYTRNRGLLHLNVSIRILAYAKRMKANDDGPIKMNDEFYQVIEFECVGWSIA